MEPIAPGTEDEPPLNFSASTKQEKERERLLSVKALLPNGKYDNVFDFKYINGTEHWYCNACACPVMGWVFHHETGKRHNTALGNENQDRFSTLPEVEETPAMLIAPGEPVPPGFEGQIEKVALIQERLDVFNVGPLVALEYLLELRDYDVSKEPAYLCILCDKKGDPRTVLTHLASYKHILQYLQKHFPTCYRALAPYMTKQYKRNWQIALHEIAEAIEKKFGRLKPLPVDADKYEKDPMHYLEHIAKGRHFSELSGYTFEELINKDELTKIHDDEGYNNKSAPRKKSPSPPVVANPIKKIRGGNASAAAAAASRRRSLSSVSSITSSDMSDYDEPKERRSTRKSKSRSPYRNRSRSRSPHVRRYGRRPSPPPQSSSSLSARNQRERGLMPWEKSNYRRPSGAPSASLSSRNSIDKMDEFKKLCRAIDGDMERILKQHKKNPEKHPQYNDEWKKFWNKRYKELQAEARDVSTHDFKPEWIEFWNKRMIELHQDEVKVKKDALRKRLGLAEEPAPISFKIVGKKKFDTSQSQRSGPKKPVPPSAMPDNDPEVIVIDDRDDESKSSRRSHSPWEDEPVVPVKKSASRDKSKERERERLRSPRRGERERCSRSPRYERTSRERSWERDYKIKEYRPRERIRVVSELPWERDSRMKSYRHEAYYKPPAVLRDVTREPVLSPPTVAAALPPTLVEEEDDGEINVVAVLRLLTALEEKLGSLGPKIIDLLAQALAMEKNEANSSENLLDNEINCVMFETVKEKLKGQLLAGLVEINQEKAFKNAIKKIASLIHVAGERKKEQEKNRPKVDPVKVPGVGTVDKTAIARQIATALVMQGKTDVSQAELEQLINAVVGMAEASKNSKTPITTASFLAQIDRAGSSKKEESTQRKMSPPPVVAQQQQVAKQQADMTKPSPEKSNNMEGLSDSDLQTLLQNFKDLSTEEQHDLINYLKKLEAREPDRVERLRKFVNLGQNKAKREEVVEEKRSGRESPFANRASSVNPSVEERKKKKEEEVMNVTAVAIDSDEEDYTFEDVVKAVSKNVERKELEDGMKAKKDESNLEDTKAIISTIMSGIGMNEVSGQQQQIGNFSGFVGGRGLNATDLAKTLNSLPVNMASLANIVGSVQNMTAGGVRDQFPGYPGVGGFGQQNVGYGQSQVRPNVTYPLDKTKVTYPNYAAYVQGSDQRKTTTTTNNIQHQQQQQQQQQGFNGGNQFGGGGSGTNRNYYNRW